MGLTTFEYVSLYEVDIAWANANSTTKTALAAAQVPTVRIDTFSATSTDTIDHLVEFWYANVLIDTINVPAGAGNGTVPPVNLMSKLLADCGLDHITIAPQKTINVKMLVAITAAKNVYFLALGGFLPAI
jgi:hypothetical protein